MCWCCATNPDKHWSAQTNRHSNCLHVLHMHSIHEYWGITKKLIKCFYQNPAILIDKSMILLSFVHYWSEILIVACLHVNFSGRIIVCDIYLPMQWCWTAGTGHVRHTHGAKTRLSWRPRSTATGSHMTNTGTTHMQSIVNLKTELLPVFLKCYFENDFRQKLKYFWRLKYALLVFVVVTSVKWWAWFVLRVGPRLVVAGQHEWHCCYTWERRRV